MRLFYRLEEQSYSDLVGQIRGEGAAPTAQGYPHRRMGRGAVKLQVSKWMRFNVKVSRVA
jgi:hypothetical protein